MTKNGQERLRRGGKLGLDAPLEVAVMAQNLSHIGHRLATAAIAGMAHGVIVILRLALPQQGLLHTTIPGGGVFVIFLGQCYRVVDVPYAGIVGGQHKFCSLVGIGDATAQHVQGVQWSCASGQTRRHDC